MTVLCLVELDGADAADVSLRALTLARTLGDSSIGAIVFADSASAPASALADYGVTDAYVIEPGHDAWVIGSEPFVAYEFDSSHYA